MLIILAFLLISVFWKVVRRDWKHAAWFGIGLALLMFIGCTPFVNWLAENSERPYAQESKFIGNADAVIMLGGMIRVSKYDTFSLTLGEATDRFTTSINLIRGGKAPVLVLGGSAPLPGQISPSASLIAEWTRSWNLTEVELLNLGVCKNTFQEAVRARSLAAERKWKKIILVTSALHMRRAEAVFRKQGFDIIPVACDFQSFGVDNRISYSIIPRQGNFDLSARYFHEILGLLYYKIRGRI